MLKRIQTTIDRVWDYCQQHKDDAWNVPRDAGQFLYAVAAATNARSILEIGTSYGFSGLHLAAAAQLNEGRLTTIDADCRKVSIARDHFMLAGLSQIVDLHCGRAEEVIAELEGPFDFVFVDAAKGDSIAYYQAFRDKLALRGVIVTDNLLTHKEEEFGEYLPALRTDPHLFSLAVPIGNGFEFTVRTV